MKAKAKSKNRGRKDPGRAERVEQEPDRSVPSCTELDWSSLLCRFQESRWCIGSACCYREHDRPTDMAKTDF